MGGNSYTLMIACLPPSDHFIDENIITLTYATKAMYISNDPKWNDDPKLKKMKVQQTRIQELEEELIAANNQINILTAINEEQKWLQFNSSNSSVEVPLKN